MDSVKTPPEVNTYAVGKKKAPPKRSKKELLA
jgi:hypothetical protein